jgi:colicin import membrane protein
LSAQVIPYTIPPEPHQWRSVGLALLVHLALLAFLWVGVSWQSLTPTTVEAEIWDPKSRDAAPPPPEPEPEPVPEPPKPTPEPKPPAPQVVPEPPKAKLADPDIALEQEKKRKQEKEKEKERERERLAEEKLAEEKQRREEQEKKQLAEEQKRQKEEQALKDKKKLEEEQKRKQEAAAAEEQKRKQEQAAEKPKKVRSAEDLERILSQAGDGEAGTAEKKTVAAGSDCELYLGKTVKSNTSFPDMPGNPVVTVGIQLTANRMLDVVKVVQPSENVAFDKQVERGLRKSGQFPADCPRDFTYSHFLKPR